MQGKRLRRNRSKRFSMSNVKPLISMPNVQSMPLVSMSDSETKSDKWSKLPEDLLRLVVDRLVEEKDFIVLRLVCASWRSALPKSYWKLVPWLLAKRYESARVVLKGLCSFENTSFGLLFQTELHWRYWGSFTGWILGQHHCDYRLKLMNPLTKVVIDLPQLHCSTIKKGLVYHTYDSVSDNPSIGVMVISDMFNGIAIINHEHKEWKILEDIRNYNYNRAGMINFQDKSEFVDVIWYKDHATAIRADGTIVFFDKARVVASISSPAHIKLKDNDNLYLVESSGDLLIMLQHCQCYKVYKLQIDTEEWIEVRALGRYSLFVGQSYSISRWMSASDTGDTWKPGCIYNTWMSCSNKGEKGLYCYNYKMKREEFHQLGHVTDYDKCYDFTWYMPAVGSEQQGFARSSQK